MKKLGAEVYLNEPIGKDKDDNEISLIDILENDEKNIEEEIDFKLKMKQIYEKIKYLVRRVCQFGGFPEGRRHGRACHCRR